MPTAELLHSWAIALRHLGRVSLLFAREAPFRGYAARHESNQVGLAATPGLQRSNEFISWSPPVRIFKPAKTEQSVVIGQCDQGFGVKGARWWTAATGARIAGKTIDLA